MLTGVLIPSLLGLALGKPAVDPSWCGRVAALDRTESRPHLEGELSRVEGELAVPDQVWSHCLCVHLKRQYQKETLGRGVVIGPTIPPPTNY